MRLDRRPAQAGDVARTGGSRARAAEPLGWSPSVRLAEGLAEQVRWACRPSSLRGLAGTVGTRPPMAGREAAADRVLRPPGRRQCTSPAPSPLGLRREGIAASDGVASIAPSVAPARRIPRALLAAGSEALSDPVGAARVGLAIGRAEPECRVDVVSRSLQWFVTQRVLDRAAGAAGVHVLGEGVLQGARVHRPARGSRRFLWSYWTPAPPRGSGPGPRGGRRADRRGRRPARRPTLESQPDPGPLRPQRERQSRRGRELLECLVEWWRASSREGEIVEVDNGDDEPRDREVALLVNRIVTLLGPAASRGGITIPSWSVRYAWPSTPAVDPAAVDPPLHETHETALMPHELDEVACSVKGNPLESVTLDPWRKPNSRRAIRRGSATGRLRGHVSSPRCGRRTPTCGCGGPPSPGGRRPSIRGISRDRRRAPPPIAPCGVAVCSSWSHCHHTLLRSCGPSPGHPPRPSSGPWESAARRSVDR